MPTIDAIIVWAQELRGDFVDVATSGRVKDGRAVTRHLREKDAEFLGAGFGTKYDFYAAGKIPGGFFKREGRPSEKETLVCRLIDRPIRPLFVKGFKNETQVICTVLSHDLENDPDIVAGQGTIGPELLARLVTLALERRSRRAALRTDYGS